MTRRGIAPISRMGVTFVTRKTGDPRGPSRKIPTVTQITGRGTAIQFRLDVSSMSLKGPPVFPMGKTLMTGKAGKSGVTSG